MPEGPSTQHLRPLVPKPMPFMVFGTEDLRPLVPKTILLVEFGTENVTYWVLGPSGCVACADSLCCFPEGVDIVFFGRPFSNSWVNIVCVCVCGAAIGSPPYCSHRAAPGSEDPKVFVQGTPKFCDYRCLPRLGLRGFACFASGLQRLGSRGRRV